MVNNYGEIVSFPPTAFHKDEIKASCNKQNCKTCVHNKPFSQIVFLPLHTTRLQQNFLSVKLNIKTLHINKLQGYEMNQEKHSYSGGGCYVQDSFASGSFTLILFMLIKIISGNVWNKNSNHVKVPRLTDRRHLAIQT